MARQQSTPDVTKYEGLVSKALAAFRIDMSYGEAMAKQATLIEFKRKVWAKKAADKEAARLAEQGGPDAA